MTATASSNPLLKTLISGSCLLFAAGANADVPIPYVEDLPYVQTGDPTTRDVPYLAWHEDLSVDGYTEEEILISSTTPDPDGPECINAKTELDECPLTGGIIAPAHVYQYADNFNQDPTPAIVSSHEYTSRVLIRRPANPADFNGVVYMEILNATAGRDGAPMWDQTYRSIIADGAAWVGVTYSESAATFLKNYWGANNGKQRPLTGRGYTFTTT
jgi:hypothetical protein